MTDFHIPLFHDTYPGNRPDATEFRAVLKRLVSRFGEVCHCLAGY